MINSKDLYTFRANVPLTSPPAIKNGEPVVVGNAVITYEIRRYRDLRNLGNKLAYQILCTQRIIIPNATPYVPGGKDTTSFLNYPAIVTNEIAMDTDLSPELVSYFPKTINSSVMTSISNNSANNGVVTTQHSSGSTVSQSNTFGVSASLGFFGDLPTGGISADYSHSWGSDHSKSTALGTESGSSSGSASSDSMTVKDWGCYTLLKPTDNKLEWVWGQEYPWNVIMFRYNDAGTNITLPNFVSSLLCDSTQVYPPSQLSLFGVDFTMKSVWVVEPSGVEETMVTHTINYYTASHQQNGTTGVNATINGPDNFTYTSPGINLCIYGLDPLYATPSDVAIVGFVPNKYIVSPSVAALNKGAIVNPTQFSIISSGNNLMINDTTDYSGLTNQDAGAGFFSSETSLTATFTQNCTSLQITLNFKIIDTVSSYMLFMKHWKTNTTGVILTILMNDDITAQTPLNPIVKYVDAAEAEGGEDNLLSIALRNLSYESVNYHDFLQLGLNTIQITVAPIGGSFSDCGYQIRAISVERG